MTKIRRKIDFFYLNKVCSCLLFWWLCFFAVVNVLWTFCIEKEYSLATFSLVISCANTRFPMPTLSLGV